MPGQPVSEASSAPQGTPYALAVLLHVRWFTHSRWVFAGAALAILILERMLFPEVHRPRQLWLVVLSVAAVNVVWTVVSHLRHRRLVDRESDQEAVIRGGQVFVGIQIATDLLLLTWILALTGGVGNPMSLFYLFHVAISGLLLRTRHAFMQSCWAVALYATMCVGQCQGWIEHYPFLPESGAGAGLHDNPQHVAVAVAIVAFAVFCTLYFMDRIGKVLDRRQAQLGEINAALHESQVAIQDLQKRRSRFMQTAAHQLKSPLAMVQTLANLIRDGIVADEEGILETCGKIVRRSRDGIAQVGELLALARVQEADPARHREAASSVCAIVEELCQKHAPVAVEKNIDMTWQVPGDTTSSGVRVHEADLKDCLGNLIENAIKYTNEGGTVRVTVSFGQRVAAATTAGGEAAYGTLAKGSVDDLVHITVKDTGMGIEPSALTGKSGNGAGATLFDAFRRGSRAIEAGIPGTGLGLSIVREVVEQAGGTIHVSSQPGEGSTFTVSFPVGAVPSTTVRDTRSSRIMIGRDDDGAD